MGQKSKSVELLQKRFGRRELNMGDTAQLNNMEEQVLKMQSEASRMFDESIRVEGVQSTVDRGPETTYKSLNNKERLEIETFFRNMKKEEFENYKEIDGAEGISSNGENFKCFAEIDGNGNIIVTPEKIISINKENKNFGTYSETRQQSNGDFITIMFEKAFGDIIGYSSVINNANLTQEDMKKFSKLKEFYANPNNFSKLELREKNMYDQSMYLKELHKLGISNKEYKSPSEMSEEEYNEAKENSELSFHASTSKYNKNIGFEHVSAIYDNDEAQNPSTVWVTNTGKNGENLQFNSYRLTKDGKYLDTSSFKIVNGEPQYNLLSKEELDRTLMQQGINIDNVYRIRQASQEQLQNKFPKEAEYIDRYADRMKEREKEDKEQEDEGPQLPSLF